MADAKHTPPLESLIAYCRELSAIGITPSVPRLMRHFPSLKRADASHACVMYGVDRARLNAATLDLLALARLVVSETDEDGEGEMPHHPREALQILRKAARAAIAKATGSAA